MAGWLIAVICISSLVVASVLFFCGAGYFSYLITIKKNGLVGKIIQWNFKKRHEEYLIDLNWWNTQNIEELSIVNQKLSLKGYLIRNGKSKKVAIIVHGYAASHIEMQPQAAIFLNEGFNVLSVDCRAHGKSGGKTIGMGWLDRKDVVKWIKKAIDLFGNDCRIMLCGLSMGAATVCMVSGENLPKNVVGIVADCPYDSVYDEFKHALKHYGKLGEYPFLPLANYFANLIGKYKFKDASALKQVKKTKTPILYIHGLADTFVPAYMSENLYNKTPENLRQRETFEGAEHAKSYASNPTRYTEIVVKFIKKCLK